MRIAGIKVASRVVSEFVPGTGRVNIVADDTPPKGQRLGEESRRRSRAALQWQRRGNGDDKRHGSVWLQKECAGCGQSVDFESLVSMTLTMIHQRGAEMQVARITMSATCMSPAAAVRVSVLPTRF
jgi:hypothetical protein